MNKRCSFHQEGDGAQHHAELAVTDLAIAVPVHGVNHLIHLGLGNLVKALGYKLCFNNNIMHVHFNSIWS